MGKLKDPRQANEFLKNKGIAPHETFEYVNNNPDSVHYCKRHRIVISQLIIDFYNSLKIKN